MKKKLVVCAALVFGLTTCVRAQTPFTDNYVYLGFPGASASTSPQQVFTTSSPTATPPFSSGVTVTGTTNRINGIGLNKEDHLLYGIGYVMPYSLPFFVNMYRVGSDGQAVLLGIVPPASSSNISQSSIVSMAAGEVQDNKYYYSSVTIKQPLFPANYLAANLDIYISEVPNISSLAPSTNTIPGVVHHKIDISEPGLQFAFQAFLNQFTLNDPTNNSGGVQDFAFNPIDHKIYTYMSYKNVSGALVGSLVVVDPVTWKASVIGTIPNTMPGVELSGSMFDQAGNFYLLFTNGQYGTVNLTTGQLNTLSGGGIPLLDGTSRGDMASIVTMMPLPVKLVSFTGRANGNKNVLQWESATEENFKAYIVEKSADGKTFSSLSEIEGKGSNGKYSYTDYDAGSVSYYRLRMLDIDATSKYSSIVTVNNTAGGITAEVYPTLINNNKAFVKSNAPNIAVSVIDMSGKVIASQQFNGGTHELSFASLSSGMYYILVIDKATNAVIARQKVLKGQ